MSNPIDRAVLRAARHTTRDEPIDLVSLLWGVDAQERMVLSHEELEGALTRLIAAGKLAEARPGHFYPPARDAAPGSFSGVSREDHAAAVARYHKEFEQALAESEAHDDQDPGGPLVVVRWLAHDGKEIGDEDEDRVDDLADQLEAVLPPSVAAEILGFEKGAAEIDVLIWGEGSNAQIDEIHRAVLPAFQRFGCPTGSHLIRHYDGGEREVPSDWVGP